LVTTDLDCEWKLDGTMQGRLKAGDVKTVQVSLGEHLVQVVSADGQDKWQTAVTVSQSGQKTLQIPLSGIRQEKAKSKTDMKDANWQASQPAIATLGTIADAIKACPKAMLFDMPELRNAPPPRVYWGPPTNVIWDITRSNSIRSPYLAYIEFTIPKEYAVPPETYDRTMAAYGAIVVKGLPNAKIRYEFDLGPEGLRLTKMLSRSAGETEWRDGSSRKSCSPQNCQPICWEDTVLKAAHAPTKSNP
jgi:hypothetical protein